MVPPPDLPLILQMVPSDPSRQMFFCIMLTHACSVTARCMSLCVGGGGDKEPPGASQGPVIHGATPSGHSSPKGHSTMRPHYKVLSPLPQNLPSILPQPLTPIHPRMYFASFYFPPFEPCHLLLLMTWERHWHPSSGHLRAVMYKH